MRKGFTLIELLVVISIIGLLSSIVLASLNTARQKAEIAKVASEMKSIQLALELYYDSNNEYPNNPLSDVNPYSTGNFTSGLDPLVTSGYLPLVPTWDTNKYEYFYFVGDIPLLGYTCGGVTPTSYLLVIIDVVNASVFPLGVLDDGVGGLTGYYCISS